MDFERREPFVRVSIPLFFAVCLISGAVMGTGMKWAVESAWWYLLTAAGLIMNVAGWRFRNQTRIIEIHETVDEIIKHIRLTPEEEKFIRKVNIDQK
jgi:hypothetical protein